MDVTLSFLTFDLENDPLPGGEGDCKYDWLEVWDGLPGGETLIKSVSIFGSWWNDDFVGDNFDKSVDDDLDGDVKQYFSHFISQYTQQSENGVYFALPTSLLTEVELQLF